MLTSYHSQSLPDVPLNHLDFCFAIGHGEIISLDCWLLLPSQKERRLRLIHSIQDFATAADRCLRKRNERHDITFLSPETFGDCRGAGQFNYHFSYTEHFGRPLAAETQIWLPFNHPQFIYIYLLER